MFNKIKKIVMAFTATNLVVDNTIQHANQFKPDKVDQLQRNHLHQKMSWTWKN